MTTPNASPRWNATTKLVVALALLGIFSALLVKFQSLVPPLFLAITLVYLLYPAAAFLNRKTGLRWGASVGVVYLLLVSIFAGLLTVAGLEVGAQLESLLNLVQNSLERLPEIIQTFSLSLPTNIGGIPINTTNLDLNSLSAQIIDSAQAMLGQTGELLGSFASGAINTLGWSAFILLVSFFLLAESGGLQEKILAVELPGYGQDFKRMGQELGSIWNAFLRGQFILIGSAILIYTVILGGLGVRYAVGIALLAGLARFLPYVGPLITWTVLGLVSYFQAYKPFGAGPFFYMALVLVIAWLVDVILDNVVSPRIMAEALKVHPAAVLVAAILALDLLGFVGVIVAAPILATFQLLTRYLIRKLFDLDPWEGIVEHPQPPSLRLQVQAWWQKINLQKNNTRKPKG